MAKPDVKKTYLKHIKKQDKKPKASESRGLAGKFLITSIIAICGLAATLIAANGEDVVKNLSAINAWMRNDSYYSAEWDNAALNFKNVPEYVAKEPEDLVVLNLEVEDGEISGSIASPKVCRFDVYPEVGIKGRTHWYGALIEIYDFYAGREVSIAEYLALPNKSAGTLVLHHFRGADVLGDRLVLDNNIGKRYITIDNPDIPGVTARDLVFRQMPGHFCPGLWRLLEKK